MKTSTEIADEIINRWANAEMGPLAIPKGRLWILRQEIADAIRAERRAIHYSPQPQSSQQRETTDQ